QPIPTMLQHGDRHHRVDRPSTLKRRYPCPQSCIAAFRNSAMLAAATGTSVCATEHPASARQFPPVITPTPRRLPPPSPIRPPTAKWRRAWPTKSSCTRPLKKELNMSRPVNPAVASSNSFWGPSILARKALQRGLQHCGWPVKPPWLARHCEICKVQPAG